MSFSVVSTPAAQDQLVELYRYIADVASSEVAVRYTDAIVTFCEDLAAFPHRGTARDDIRPGLRMAPLVGTSSHGGHTVLKALQSRRQEHPPCRFDLAVRKEPPLV